MNNNTPTYVDAATLTIAREVAAAEGITLAEALRDQVELFGGVL
jgi:hypothetical protein